MNKKNKYALIFISILIGLIIILPILFKILEYVYFNTGIFYNERVEPVTCSSAEQNQSNTEQNQGVTIMSPLLPSTGKKVPCDKNSDCEREKIKEYCAPNEVNYSRIFCHTWIKCSPDKICEYYCH